MTNEELESALSAALGRIAALERRADSTDETIAHNARKNTDMFKAAASVESVRKVVTNTNYIQPVIDPSADDLGFMPGQRPKPWVPSASSEDPMERDFAAALATDGTRSGLSAPRRMTGDGDSGAQAAKLSADLHAAYKAGK